MLDRERRGAIPTPLFDRTMLLFSEVLEEDQLPELRAQLGFVNPAEVLARVRVRVMTASVRVRVRARVRDRVRPNPK